MLELSWASLVLIDSVFSSLPLCSGTPDVCALASDFLIGIFLTCRWADSRVLLTYEEVIAHGLISAFGVH